MAIFVTLRPHGVTTEEAGNPVRTENDLFGRYHSDSILRYDVVRDFW